MKDYFFTSDTHFSHKRVLAYRPFATLQEMDEALVANWNAVVKPGDDVYHLGDFAWKNAQHYRNRLVGNIYKIKGNHHGAAKKIAKDFCWMKDVLEVKIPYMTHAAGVCTCNASWPEGVHHHQCPSRFPVFERQRIWLSHYAHRVWPRMHHGVWHLYGHSHGNLKDDQNQLSMDVGVDAVARYLAGIDTGFRDVQFEELCELKLNPLDYRPVRFDEIQRWMSFKHFTPVDHHTGPEVGG